MMARTYTCILAGMFIVLFLSAIGFAKQTKTQSSTMAASPITALSEPERSKLEEFVAREIIDAKLKESSAGLLSPEGSLIAHVKMEFEAAKDSPFRLWKYEQGKLSAAKGDDFQKAVGSERKDWPPFLFLFSVRSIDSTSAVIEVRTVYSMGKAQNGRGGNQADWELAKTDGKWSVAKKNTILFWD